MTKATDTQGKSANVPAQKKRYNDIDLKEIGSFADAMRLAQATGEVTNISDVLGDGFELLASPQKASLVNQRLVILEWNFSTGKQGEFVSFRGMTGEGKKFVANDGSTGVYAQLKALTDSTAQTGGLFVEHGLRVSNYEYEDDKGKKQEATTYYLNTSA